VKVGIKAFILDVSIKKEITYKKEILAQLFTIFSKA
jgi:hypothetical protein